MRAEFETTMLGTWATKLARWVRSSPGVVFVLKFLTAFLLISLMIQYDRKYVRQSDLPEKAQMPQKGSEGFEGSEGEVNNPPTYAACRKITKASFNPYTIQGLPIQHFEPRFAKYETSCLPLKFSTSYKFPKTVLASHPGSGNTWSRHLIQQLTGLYIGSVYNDILISEEQPSRFDKWERVVWNGSCVAIKSHAGTMGFPDPNPALYDKAIIVIRRPHDSMLAEFKRRHWDVSSNVTVLSKEIFKDFRNYFGDIIKSWVNFHLKWLTADICMLVVQYEDLKYNLHSELKRIGQFLGINPDDLQQSHLDCIGGNTGGKLRWPKPTMEESPYSANMNTTLSIHTEHVRHILRTMHGVTWKI